MKNIFHLAAVLLACAFLCGCFVYSTEKDGVTTIKGVGLEISTHPNVGIRLGVFERQTKVQNKD